MTWSKIDDQLHAHPKVQHAWHADPAALGLHLLALSHAGAFLTDGHVPETFVRTHLASPTKRRRAVAALVSAGLWETAEGGWQIHDFLDFNQSRQEVTDSRSVRAVQAADAGRKGAAKRWHPRRSPSVEQMAPGCNGEAMAPAPYPFPG